ncbi:MAG: hypothetical protein KF775_18725 [Cyclobacteriaceae bacterium]|nr:hypothetical protein [Cytophagales bacterium]MBX2901691.1 hypothetical protein [Cyclobacteriaceae bacterium]
METIYAERKPNTIRKFITRFRFGASLGYGNTYMQHGLDDFGILKRPGFKPRVFYNTTFDSTYTNWINRAKRDTLAITPATFLVRGDTAKIGFKGRGKNIPFQVTIHYEFLKRYRLGAGYGYEHLTLGTFEPISYKAEIGTFRPDHYQGWMRKFFGYAGGSFYRIDKYLFTGDLQVGSYKPGRNFDNSLIKRGAYFNLGVTAERELSEYLRLFARTSYEFKRYNLAMPESNNSTIRHRMNAAYLQVGLTYSIPELPRCYLKDCKIQINHAHGNKEYRSRVHPIFKKQNPGYGENHPELIKYKGKNKRKLNPY